MTTRDSFPGRRGSGEPRFPRKIDFLFMQYHTANMNNNETENTDTAEIEKTSIFNMKKDEKEENVIENVIEEKEKTDCPAITCLTLFVILLLSGAAFAFFMIIMLWLVVTVLYVLFYVL